MLMTRDNPSIATNVNTITSSVTILSIGNVRMKPFCHRLVRQKMDSGAADLFSVRTCPVFIEVSFQPVLKVLRVRAIFLNQNSRITRSRVQNPCWLICFFVDFPVSGVVRAKSQKVKLWCNVKLSDDMPPRTSQWNFLLENW